MDHIEKTEVTSTRHTLPFGNLSDDEFERLCYWVVERSSKFDAVQHYGMAGDKKRDVIGNKHNKAGKPEQWYFQCKNRKRVSLVLFKGELDAIKKHSDEIASFKPDVIVFVTGCSVSTGCKDSTSAYAREIGFSAVYFWDEYELDEIAKATEGVVKEFFKGGVNLDDLHKKIDDLPERVAEAITLKSELVFRHPSQVTKSDYERQDEINKEIDEAVKCIHENRIGEAKNKLFALLGKVEGYLEKG